MLTTKDIANAMEKAGVQIDVDLEQSKNSTFADLGLDSMDIFNLFLELEAITDKAVPDEEIDNINTIGDVLEFYN